MAANLWEDNALKHAFVRLGLTDVAARKFMENGVTDVHQLRSLSKEALHIVLILAFYSM
jgi:hypothetical protein